MAQTAIPTEFERYFLDQQTAGKPISLTEVIFAYIPGLDPQAPIYRGGGIPDRQFWVHRQSVDQVGRIGEDIVAYSVIVTSDVKPFTFNAIYLHDPKVANSCAMIIHLLDEPKDIGNAMTKTLMLEFDGGAEAANITVDASTWQIDFSARLDGMDEDHRHGCLDFFGPVSFESGFGVTLHSSGKYRIEPGLAYIGGLRTLATTEQTVSATAPNALWVDVYREGAVTSRWQNKMTIKQSSAELKNYVDAYDRQHYVAKLATINADGSITDERVSYGFDAEKIRSGVLNPARLPDASTREKGAVKLSSALNSSSEKLAATAGALSKVYQKANHSHPFDNYGGWNLKVNGSSSGKVTADAGVNFIQGANVSLSKSGNTITISSTNTHRPIHDEPVNGATTIGISSNWAFDNVKTAVPAGAKFTDTNTWRPVSDSTNSTSSSNAASSKAVKAAYDKASHSHPYRPSSWMPTAADVGALPKNGKAANSAKLNDASNSMLAHVNSIAQRDSSGDITARLMRSTYGNESRLTGAVAFRVNNDSDNCTRWCSNPAALRSWLSISTTAVYDGRYLAKSGTAANANKVGGLAAASFLRSDSNDSFSGDLISTSRSKGIFGVYDSQKIDQIWSMGTSYRVNANGSNFGNLYGAAYKHVNNATGGTMADGHQFVWCQNGVPKVALGTNLWTSGAVYEQGQPLNQRYQAKGSYAASNHSHSNYAPTNHNHDSLYWKRTEAVTKANSLKIGASASTSYYSLLWCSGDNVYHANGKVKIRPSDGYMSFSSGATYGSTVQAPRLQVSNDTDTYMSSAGVFDDGQRVYSKNNPPKARDVGAAGRDNTVLWKGTPNWINQITNLRLTSSWRNFDKLVFFIGDGGWFGAVEISTSTLDKIWECSSQNQAVFNFGPDGWFNWYKSSSSTLIDCRGSKRGWLKEIWGVGKL